MKPLIKRKFVNVWMTAGVFAVLYALVFKTILTAWINPKGNEFTFSEYLISMGETAFSLGSFFLSFLIINKLFPKLSFGYKYCMILMLSSIIFVIMFLPYWVLFTRLFLHGLPTDTDSYAPEALSRILSLHLPVSVIIIISLYTYQTHKTELQLLAVQKALAETQLKNLQQQVDPHFLFNSLNILAALITLDADRAVVFTQRLSEVYRFFLKTKKDVLISLEEEIEFVGNYFFLISCRFGNAFGLKINQNNISCSDLYIIPGTVQLLVENVIKHNVADEKEPIQIEVSINENYISVTNQLVKKNTVASGYGLKNLVIRYQLFNGQKVGYYEKGNSFYVQVPLIKKI